MANIDAAVPGEPQMERVLGEQIKEYRVRHRFLSTWISLVIDVIAIIIGVSILGWAGYSAYQNYYYHGPAAVWHGLLIPIIVGLILMVCGLAGLRRIIIRFNTRATLYKNGLVVRQRSGEKRILWHELASIRNRYRTGTFRNQHETILTCQDGERVILDSSLQNMKELVQLIKQNSIAELYQHYRPVFEENFPLKFGPILVKQEEGITVHKRAIPWEQIRGVKVEKGKMHFDIQEGEKKNTGMVIPVNEIPNLEVLLAFIQNCSRTNQAR